MRGGKLQVTSSRLIFLSVIFVTFSGMGCLFAEEKTAEKFRFSFRGFTPSVSREEPGPGMRDVRLAHALILAGADVNERMEFGRTPLFFAGTAAVAQALVNAGADVNAKNRNGFTPIFYARNGSVTETLLSAGAKPETHPSKITPLHTAPDAKAVRLLTAAGVDVHTREVYLHLPPICTVKNGKVVEALIKAGADPLFKTEHHLSPLHLAPDEAAVKTLLASGANVNLATIYKKLTPLHLWAAEKSFSLTFLLDRENLSDKTLPAADYEEVNHYFHAVDRTRDAPKVIPLLLAASADENAKNANGETPLFYARTPEIVSLLLKHAADANVRNHAGYTPLHLAKDAGCVRLLLGAKGNPRAVTVKNQSPLHFAADAECVRLLLEAGADSSVKDRNGEMAISYVTSASAIPPLIEAMRRGGESPAKYLNEKSKKGRTPFLAAYENFSESWKSAENPLPFKNQGRSLSAVLQVFLDFGAEVNTRDARWRTMLFFMSRKADVEMLLRAGANVKITDRDGVTPLSAVLENGGEPDAVRLLLNAGADANAADRWGRTPLSCVKYDRRDVQEMVKMLVSAGAEVNPKRGLSRDGAYPLLYLAQTEETIRFLINSGAGINARGGAGEVTPIFSAAGNIPKMRMLIAAGANVNAKNTLGETPIFSSGMTPECLRMLLDAGAEVNVRDLYGRTPVFRHISSCSRDFLRMLADAGADLNGRDENSWTLLFFVRDAAVMKFLLEKGLDANARDMEGNTPLHAVSSAECAAVLLSAGADVNAKNKKGRTPLHTQVKDAEIVTLLLKSGADGNARDTGGNTPIYFQAGGNLMTLSALLEAGADVHAQNESGDTPLHLLVTRDEMVSALLEHGANGNQPNHAGRTPLHSRLLTAESLRILIAAGADVRARDAEGKTPLFTTHEKECYDLLIAAGARVQDKDKNGRFPKIINAKTAAEIAEETLRDYGNVAVPMNWEPINGDRKP